MRKLGTWETSHQAFISNILAVFFIPFSLLCQYIAHKNDGWCYDRKSPNKYAAPKFPFFLPCNGPLKRFPVEPAHGRSRGNFFSFVFFYNRDRPYSAAQPDNRNEGKFLGRRWILILILFLGGPLFAVFLWAGRERKLVRKIAHKRQANRRSQEKNTIYGGAKNFLAFIFPCFAPPCWPFLFILYSGNPGIFFFFYHYRFPEFKVKSLFKE